MVSPYIQPVAISMAKLVGGEISELTHQDLKSIKNYSGLQNKCNTFLQNPTPSNFMLFVPSLEKAVEEMNERKKEGQQADPSSIAKAIGLIDNNRYPKNHVLTNEEIMEFADNTVTPYHKTFQELTETLQHSSYDSNQYPRINDIREAATTFADGFGQAQDHLSQYLEKNSERHMGELPGLPPSSEHDRPDAVILPFTKDRGREPGK